MFSRYFVHKAALQPKMWKSEKGDNLVKYSYIYRILPKVNQVIYTLDTICEPNMMILRYFVHKVPYYGLQWESKKGAQLCNDKSDGKEKNKGLLIFHGYSTYQISRSYL